MDMPLLTASFTPTGFEPTFEQQAIALSQRRVTLVHANAGAAKTTTLALRIGEALARGLAPEHILALVFTTEAREVMLARLIEIGIAPTVARRVHVHTMDEFSARVLASVEDGVEPARLTDDAFKQYALQAMEQVAAFYADRVEYLDLRTHNLALSELQATQTQIKARMALDDELQDLPLAEAAETLGLPLTDYLTLIEYEKIRLGSFDQVQFRGPHDATYDLATLLTRYPDQADTLPHYRLIVGDELHDLNEAAFRVLRSLIDLDGVYFVGAGDRDQVIHARLGADESYLMHRFQARYPGCTHLPLTMTWRHGPHLAYATQAFKEKPVDSSLPLQTVITELAYDDAFACGERVVEAITKWKVERKPLEGCAILLRERHQSVVIENALMRAGIAYRTAGMPGYMQREEILFLRGMLAIALKNLAAVSAIAVRRNIVESLALFAEVPMSPEDLERAKADIAAEPGMLKFFFSGQIQRVGSTQARARIGDAVAYLESLDADTPAHEALTELCRRLDIDAIAKRLYLRPRDAQIVTRSIEGFIDAARHANTDLRGFSEWLGAADAFDEKRRTRHSVLLDCAANAKGKEFDHVILPFLDAHEFPASSAPLREEENLFYVATTRARARLTLIAPTDADHRSPFITRMQLIGTRARANTALQANQQRAETQAARQHLAAARNQATGPAAGRPPSTGRAAGPTGTVRTIGSSPAASRSSTSSPGSTPGVSPSGRIDLRVPYADKDVVKRMGAQWDPVRKTWYVKAGLDPAPFAAWFGAT